MNIGTAEIKESVDPDTVRSVSKLALTAVWLVLVLALLTVVPGIERLVPHTPVTFAALVGAIATLVMVGLLLYLAPKLASFVRMSLDGSRDVVDSIASVVYWSVVLVAVLVAHLGLAGAIRPLFDVNVWFYDVIFLGLALPAVVMIARRLYTIREPGSELLAEQFVDEEPDDVSERDEMAGPSGE